MAFAIKKIFRGRSHPVSPMGSGPHWILWITLSCLVLFFELVMTRPLIKAGTPSEVEFLHLERQSLELQNQLDQFQIPGMTASVSILTGKRTVLNYLFKPLIKAREESLGER